MIDYEKILDELPEEEQERINDLALQLSEAMRIRLKAKRVGNKAMFGRKSALEILAKLGIFMVVNNWDGQG